MTRILVVDNKNYSSLFLSLKEWGYEVEMVHTLPESRDILMSLKFDVTFIGLDAGDLPVIFHVIKELHNTSPIIGITSLSENKLNRLLEDNNISRSDFMNIIRLPLTVEDIIFAIEETLTQYPETVITEEKPLTKKERQQRLTERRHILENQRLTDFLSANLKQNIFEE